MILNSPYISGSLTVTGNEVVTGSLTVLGGITGAITGSATSASYAANTSLLNNKDSGEFVLTGSFNSYTSSNDATVTSVAAAAVSAVAGVNALAARTGSYTTTSSFNSYTASNNTTMSCVSSTATSAIAGVGALAAQTGSYATTGSNTFVGGQYLSSSFNPTGFTTTASLYTDGGLRVGRDAYISGTLYLNNVTVFGTQSVAYITSSQLNISTNLVNVNTDTPSVRFGGLAVYDSGSTGLTGSILWDSQNNHWVYTNPSGSSYSGGMFIAGPRASSLGTEVGTTACALMMGQGGDHITSSAIFHYGNATCFYGNSRIDSSGNICNAGSVCSNNIVLSTGYSAAATASVQVWQRTGGAVAADMVYNDANTSMNFGTSTAHSLNIKTNNTTALNLNSAGAACFASSVSTGGNLTVNGGAVLSRINLGYNFCIENDQSPEITSFINSSGTSVFRWLQGASPAEKMRLSNLGYLGIGTCAPQSILHLCTINTTAAIRIESACDQAGVRLIAGIPGTARASRIDFLNGATCVGRPQWTIINDYNQNGTNDLSFVNCDPVTRVMTITQNGCIGIGTNTPSSQLHIVAPYAQGASAISANWSGVGGFTATLTCASGVQPYATYTFSNGDVVVSTNNPTIRFQTITTTTTDMMQIVGASYVSSGPFNCNKISAFNSSHLSFETAGSPRMIINNAGNILLGTTSEYGPGFKLQINGSAYITGIVYSNSGFYINSGQYAGITEAPYTGIYMTNSSSGDGFGALLVTSRTDVARPIIFGTSNGSTSVERMRISSGGNIGIGCIAPAYPLHVNGQIYSSTNVSAANSRILNQQSSNTWADNSAHTVTGAISEVSGIIRVINNLDGTNTDIPFYASGGSGVAYRWTVLDPDTGWIINTDGWNFNFTTNGSQSRTFNLQASNGSGNVTIQQASGTANYTMKIFIYSQA